MQCKCPHEDCGATFTHYGEEHETTVCPECGRQQRPHQILSAVLHNLDIRQELTDNALLDLTNDDLIAAGSQHSPETLDRMREEAIQRKQ